jgi:hypothetical protein
MKKVINQNVVVSAFVSMLITILIGYMFSGDDAMHYFFFDSIVIGGVLIVSTLIPLIIMDGVFSGLYFRENIKVRIWLKIIINIIVIIVLHMLLRVDNKEGLSFISYIKKCFDSITVMTMISMIIYRVMRWNAIECFP